MLNKPLGNVPTVYRMRLRGYDLTALDVLTCRHTLTGLILITIHLSLVADPTYIPGDVSLQLGKSGQIAGSEIQYI